MSHKKEEPKNESTAHKKVPADVNEGATASGDTGPMPMGMTGEASDGDPDQKSTHNAPNTVQGALEDGTPKFENLPKKVKKAKGPHTKGGTFTVISPIRTAKGHHDVGDEVELDAEEANSVAEHIEKV